MAKIFLSIISAVALIAVVAVFYLGTREPSAPATEPVAAAPAPAGDTAAHAPKPPAVFHTGLEKLPRSLKGTQVDGRLEVDSDGHLKITKGVRDVFDYFLSMIGEESLDTITKRIRAYIQSQLQPPASDEAEHILDQYIAYKKAMVTLEKEAGGDGGSMDINAMRNRLAQEQALRNQYMDPQVVQAFFGNEHAYDQYTLDRMQIMKNKNLSDEERNRQLQALKQELPESMREQDNAVSKYQRLRQAQQNCEKQGCSAEQLHQARANVVGEAAANRLDALDQQNAQWQEKVQSWFSRRDAILHNDNLSPSDRQAQIDEQRKKLFSGGELARVKALEGLHDNGQPIPGFSTKSGNP